MQIEGTSSIGLVRENNQDRYAIIYHPVFGDLVSGIVCDGVGGSKAGEVAASIVVNEYVKEFQTIESYDSLVDLRNWAKQTLSLINHKVYDLANSSDEFYGMSTTVVLFIQSPYGTLFVNVGDSRIYMIDENHQLVLLSYDHSLVYDMVQKGSLSKSEASTHPLRNALTNAIGIFEEVRLDLHEIKQPYRSLLLSSDGLHGYVKEDKIESILLNPKYTNRQKVLALVAEAEKAGGPDNITVVYLDNEAKGD